MQEVYKNAKFAKLCEKKLCELCVILSVLCGKKNLEVKKNSSVTTKSCF